MKTPIAHILVAALSSGFAVVAGASTAHAGSPAMPDVDVGAPCVFARLASPARAMDDREERLQLPASGCTASSAIYDRLLPRTIEAAHSRWMKLPVRLGLEHTQHTYIAKLVFSFDGQWVH